MYYVRRFIQTYRMISAPKQYLQNMSEEIPSYIQILDPNNIGTANGKGIKVSIPPSENSKFLPKELWIGIKDAEPKDGKKLYTLVINDNMKAVLRILARREKKTLKELVHELIRGAGGIPQ